MDRPHRVSTTATAIAGPNRVIIDEFSRLIIYLKNKLIKTQDSKEASHLRFRIRSLEKSLAIIAKITTRIRTVDAVSGMPGIGPGTTSRLQEILDTGKLSEIKGVTRFAVANADAVRDLLSVINIGESMAVKLVAQGVKSVSDLQHKVANGSIQVNDKIKLGLKYAGTAAPIPRAEVTAIRTVLLRMLTRIDPALIGNVCGSYRRGRAFSNDIDFLIVHPNMEAVDTSDVLERYVRLLQDKHYLVDSLTGAAVSTKYMGFFKLPKTTAMVRRIDIRFIPFRSQPSALLYFTGPGEFNKNMRSHAKRQGYKLNEYGLFKITRTGVVRRVMVKTEADIFRLLHMDYLTPHERDTATI